ncbi:energy-coupling factor transport system ATP-binding protein [Paenibacillus endophyticus]|uniref:Energy-coupling factor transport system ATP-binding protein n=1 Tax=Paenibacillus endophyticus TaxID=1294268 RepID=A0A7W5C998_9BACL|nr:ATP-binding cassette domain-containing protein [Paenibacillus endophyticus]MBB3153496.1 energy-coupling factor transport system ATP-binding protein [Paenibacillus endophyticus]
METYRIEDVVFAFPEKEKEALSHISLTIKSGEFITICGKSGCGKSTLLRQLKSILTPHGKRSGKIYFCGQPIEEVDQRTQASEIGFVLQNPDNQIVTDKVWHELAFGLESLGCDSATIRLRVAEMASFFGIHTWFRKNVSELSGGQKQLLNLASIMAMHPSVLILDEPTSQLDPIAASDFLETVKKINRELGTTIIMTEHRLEEIIPITDRLIVMDEGAIIAEGLPEHVGAALNRMKHPMFLSMPTPMQIHAGVSSGLPSPVTVKDGRQWLNAYMSGKTPVAIDIIEDSPKQASAPVIQFKDVWFKHDRNGPDVIKDLTFTVEAGQFYCLVGGNGTGKTTTLSLMSGILQPYRGKILIGGKNPLKMNVKELFTNNVGILPQNPQTLFVKKTVRLDLYEMLSQTALTKEEKASMIDEMVAFAELDHLLDIHPYDLSGGEQQRAALAKVLLLEPRVLLLDEPTKGLDGFFKEKLARFLQKLNASGVTIVMVSHDVEFCAKYGEICSMFFDGSMITTNTAIRFFAGNSFYTTAANRMARHIWSDGVTIEGVIERCQKSR